MSIFSSFISPCDYTLLVEWYSLRWNDLIKALIRMQPLILIKSVFWYLHISLPECLMILAFTGFLSHAFGLPAFGFSLAGLALTAMVLIFLLMTCCHVAEACFNRLGSDRWLLLQAKLLGWFTQLWLYICQIFIKLMAMAHILNALQIRKRFEDFFF